MNKIACWLVHEHYAQMHKHAGLSSFLRKPGVRIPGMALALGGITAGSAALAKEDLDTKTLVALGLLGGAGGALLGHKMR